MHVLEIDLIYLLKDNILFTFYHSGLSSYQQELLLRKKQSQVIIEDSGRGDVSDMHKLHA